MTDDSDTEGDGALRLENGQYAKVGVVHCGVSYQGQVSVAGDVAILADGETRDFLRAGVMVERSGDVHVFRER